MFVDEITRILCYNTRSGTPLVRAMERGADLFGAAPASVILSSQLSVRVVIVVWSQWLYDNTGFLAYTRVPGSRQQMPLNFVCMCSKGMR